jgi:uncharacterized protein YecE (DUF72 family)
VQRARIGTMGWSYDFWVGTLYPSGTKARDYLAEYSKHFDTVEANSTFYRIPSANIVRNWKARTSDGFVITAKFPMAITHGRSLKDDDGKLEAFLSNISLLGEKLGPLLIQLPPSFKPQEYGALRDLLWALPEGYRYAVEFRDRGWLEERIYVLLREREVALVLVDHPWMPSLDVVTSDFVYIRWQGDRRKVSGDTGRAEVDRKGDLNEWAKRITGFLESSLDVYGYFSKFFSGYPPEDIAYLLEQLGR